MPYPTDTRALRDALGRFATGVTVVTTLAADKTPIGLTANSFAAVSLNPALILWSLQKDTPDFDEYCRCSHYAISVLAADQIDISQRFAAPLGNKFEGLSWSHGIGDVPILANMHTVFQCANKQRYEGGDHLIFIGEVLEFEQRYAEPLLFVGGRYGVADLSDNTATRPFKTEPASGRFIDDYLAYLIGRASFLINRQFDQQLKRRGVKPAVWRVLASLADGGLSVGELAEIVLMKQPTLTKLLDGMVAEGLVQRLEAGDDRRKVIAHITEGGRALVGELLQAAKLHEEHILDGLEYSDRVRLKQILDGLIERHKTLAP